MAHKSAYAHFQRNAAECPRARSAISKLVAEHSDACYARCAACINLRGAHELWLMERAELDGCRDNEGSRADRSERVRAVAHARLQLSLRTRLLRARRLRCKFWRLAKLVGLACLEAHLGSGREAASHWKTRGIGRAFVDVRGRWNAGPGRLAMIRRDPDAERGLELGLHLVGGQRTPHAHEYRRAAGMILFRRCGRAAATSAFRKWGTLSCWRSANSRVQFKDVPLLHECTRMCACEK